MKLPFKKSDTLRLRPYWHVDLKWICAILLTAVLAATLPVTVAHRLTEKGPATNLIAYTMAGMTSPQGIDSEAGLAEMKARVLEKGSETVKLAGIDVVFTAQDMNTLSPRELRLKVFRAFADRFYDQGAKGLAQNQGFDAATVKKFENDASLINLFSAEMHERIGTVLLWMALADLLLVAAVIFFSRRFGRLVSPGVVFLLVGLPGIVLGAIASQNPEVTGAARSENPSDPMAMIGLFGSYVAPLIAPHAAGIYLFVLLSGAVMLVVAALGRIAYGFVQRGSSKDSSRGAKE